MSITRKRGRPRVNVREFPCSACGTMFGQTANEVRKKTTKCKDCRKALEELRKPKPPNPDPPARPIFEVVLPTFKVPWFCKKRGEWYLKVRVRKKHTDEPLKQDRIWLGLGENATKEQAQEALNTLVAKMLMDGRVKPLSRELLKKKQNHRIIVRKRRKSWIRGKDRGYGIIKRSVTYVRYAVRLPDPQHPYKVVTFSKHRTKVEARKARMAHYREFSRRVLPCAICGMIPDAFLSNGRPLSHITADCSNKVQFPPNLRPLFQTKLWNILFASGERKNVGILTKEDLRDMGFMGVKGAGYKLHVRTEVEFDFRAAAKYAKTVKDEDPVFE